MKTQIFAVIFGLMLSLANASFAQTTNYKQQFHKSETSQVCSNFSTSVKGDQNYKHVANIGSFKADTSPIAKCCDNTACAKSECCKNNSCTKDCCHKNQVSTNYKHLNSAALKNSCAKSACVQHKDSCCN